MGKRRNRSQNKSSKLTAGTSSQAHESIVKELNGAGASEKESSVSEEGKGQQQQQQQQQQQLQPKE